LKKYRQQILVFGAGKSKSGFIKGFSCSTISKD